MTVQENQCVCRNMETFTQKFNFNISNNFSLKGEASHFVLDNSITKTKVAPEIR